MRTLTDYAAKGLHVFPCYTIVDGECNCNGQTPSCTPGKHPRNYNGATGASCAHMIIERWEAEQVPYNVGLACGAINGFIVLDFDPDGLEKLAEFGEQYGMPITPTVKTGRGYHYYFKWDEKYTLLDGMSRVGALPGVDVRSTGDYVIAPPSKGLVGNWEWMRGRALGEVELAEIPDGIWAEITAGILGMVKEKGRAKPVSTGELRAVEDIAEGGRNEALFKHACSLIAKYGYGAVMLESTLVTYNKEHCKPPLDKQEVIAIAANAYAKYDPGKVDYAPSDIGNAQRFEKRYGDKVRWIAKGQSAGAGVWSVYDGLRWSTEVSSAARVAQYAEATALGIFDEVKKIPIEEHDKRKALTQHANASCSASRLEAMQRLAKTRPGLASTADEYDTQTHLVNLANGTLDLETMTLRKHKAEDHITKLIPFDYKPDAKAERWERFIEEVFPDKALAANVQRILGTCLTGSITEQELYILTGIGSNGKNVLTDTLGYVLNDYASSASNKLWVGSSKSNEAQLAIAQLKGYRFVTSDETADGNQISADVVKMLTGGSKAVGRMHFEGFSSYTPTYKLFLQTNHLPKVRDNSVGLWRRLVVIPFDTRFYPASEAEAGQPIADPNLTQYLQEHEAEGILAWLVRGYVEHTKVGKNHCDRIRKERAAYMLDEDIVSAWLDECIHIPEHTHCTSYSKDLYESFVGYSGWRNLSRKKFAAFMTQKGYESQWSREGRYYDGLQLMEIKP